MNQFKKSVNDMNGSIIEGKFEKSARPDTILASALNEYFDGILQEVNKNKKDSQTSMKWRIQDAIGSCEVDGINHDLFEILPNLQKWISEDGYNVSSDDKDASEDHVAKDAAAAAAQIDTPRKSRKGGIRLRLKFMFCKLMGAIACKVRPLVLFMDDLQCTFKFGLVA